jgi:transposase
MLMMGYFEGIGSERGIAWRCSDSWSLRKFLGFGPAEETPDHSTVSRTRRLIAVESHQGVIGWALKTLTAEGLVDGKTLGVDASLLEANAVMKSIVRRDTGEDYKEFLTGLAKESGIETPTAEELARMDRNRKRKISNKDWEHPDLPTIAASERRDTIFAWL